MAKARTNSYRLRALLSTAASLLLHVGVAAAFVEASGVFGVATAPSDSTSLEAVQTILVEAIEDIEQLDAPAQSTAQRAAIDMPEPSPQMVQSQVEPVPKPREPDPPVEKQVTAEQVPPPPSAPAIETPPPPEPAVPVKPLSDNGTVAMLTLPPELKPVEQPRPEDVKPETRADQEVEEKQSKQQETEARERQERAAENKRKEEEKRKVEDKRKSDQREQENRMASEQAQQARAASAASSSPVEKGTGGGRTKATKGDIVNYAAKVRAKVARNKPSGSGHRGTAIVTFGIASTGIVTFANLQQSSGSPKLDEAAVAAVKSSGPFAATPGGEVLAFSVPFHFQ